MAFLRKILFVFAVLLLVVGGLEFVFKQGTVDLSRAMFKSYLWMRLIGIVALFFGIVLIMAARRRAIGLAVLFMILGGLEVAVAAMLLVYPPMFTGFIHAVFLNRSHGTQMFVVQLSGLIRIVLGLLLLYAIGRSPQAPTEPAG